MPRLLSGCQTRPPARSQPRAAFVGVGDDPPRCVIGDLGSGPCAGYRVGGGPARAKTAPSGSVRNAIRPNGLFIGSPCSDPPPATAAATAASVSVTEK